jgi:hypothetical protein
MEAIPMRMWLFVAIVLWIGVGVYMSNQLPNLNPVATVYDGMAHQFETATR